MAKQKRTAGSLVPIDRLDPEAGEGTWRAVIETPKGSHNKYKYEPELGTFTLAGVLPEGMSFPYDFGFFPSTKADDGDPLDVLLLMDQPAFCGCVVDVRLVGVIEAEQASPGEEPERNDRLIAVAVKSRVHADCHRIEDLPERRVHEIKEFFNSYNRVRAYRFNVLAVRGPDRAEELLREAMPGRPKRRKRK